MEYELYEVDMLKMILKQMAENLHDLSLRSRLYRVYSYSRI